MKRVLTAAMVWMIMMTGAMAETPQEGAKAILDLIKARNYQELFPTRYSEWHKVEAEGVPVDKAVEKLSRMFEKKHEMIVGMYEQLATADFTMGKSEIVQKGETGDMATAEVTVGDKKVPFRLYKMENGKWGFHL